MKSLFWWGLTLIPLSLFGIGFLLPASFTEIQISARDWVLGFGGLAFLIFIILQILQVVVTPFNHYLVGLLGGFIFGPWLGFLLNWVGRVIGHTLAFYLARKFLRPWLKKHFKNQIQRYDGYLNKPFSGYFLTLIYFLPLFPDDEISYLAGLSSFSEKKFMVANLFGQIGGSIGLAYAGSGIDTKDPLFWLITSLTLLGFLAMACLNRQMPPTKA